MLLAWNQPLRRMHAAIVLAGLTQIRRFAFNAMCFSGLITVGAAVISISDCGCFRSHHFGLNRIRIRIAGLPYTTHSNFYRCSYESVASFLIRLYQYWTIYQSTVVGWRKKRCCLPALCHTGCFAMGCIFHRSVNDLQIVKPLCSICAITFFARMNFCAMIIWFPLAELFYLVGISLFGNNVIMLAVT